MLIVIYSLCLYKQLIIYGILVHNIIQFTALIFVR